MKHKHLMEEERHYIEIEIKAGRSQKEIGLALGRSQSTISREVKRNAGKRGYRYKQANRIAQSRHRAKPKAIKMTDAIKKKVKASIKEDWSPEQVAGRLKDDGIISLHHETIYRYVIADKKAGGLLYTHLRHQNKTYRKRYGTARNRTGIPNRTSISERPEVANKRQRIGDWEADTIIGKKHRGAIVTLDERKSKLRLALPLQRKQAEGVKESMVALLNPIKQFVKTITFDNGKEFTQHESIAESLSCHTYFAQPYHSWERGQNENANGLLRQYFPKSMELIDISVKRVVQAVHKLNNRPRKCLGFKTPYEAFQKETGLDINALLGYAFMS